MDGWGGGCDGSGSLQVWAPWDCSGHRPADPAQPVKFLLHKNLKFSILQIHDHFLSLRKTKNFLEGIRGFLM